MVKTTTKLKRTKLIDQLMLTNRATRLKVIQGHQTWYHWICCVRFPSVL